jgi:hypothetical protein
VRLILQYVHFSDREIFRPFRAYIFEFSQEYLEENRIQFVICQLLTTILLQNPILLLDSFEIVFDPNEQIAASALLALANAFCTREDFTTEYQSGVAAIIAATLSHVSGDHLLTRQASFKLLCLMTTKGENIFVNDVPISLAMNLTSQTPIGYTIQAQHFVAFASKSLKPEIAFEVFDIIMFAFRKLTSQTALLLALVEFVPLMITARPLDVTLNTMIRLTGCCDDNLAPTAVAVKNLWTAYCRSFKDVQNGHQKEMIKGVFDFGVSKDPQTAVIVLSYIFNEYPEEAADFLLPFVLNQFSRQFPLDPSHFVTFLNAANITLIPGKAEIIASNALSQILLMIESRESFISLFGGQINSLVLAALITRSSESFNIGRFHALLDSLLDAALFRFAANNSMFSSNLETLQLKNLIKRATSLNGQDMITTDEGSRTILAYNDELIAMVTDLFSQVDEQFRTTFFAQELTLAFQIAPQNPRSVEPFLMVMASGKEMSTISLYYILLFTLYVFQTNRVDLMDCLVDCIKSHLLALPIDSSAFEVESMPAIIILLLYLSLKVKLSTALHIMGIIAEVAQRVCESPAKAGVGSAVLNYLKSFEGDEYIAFLFLRFVQEMPSFGDVGIGVIVRCLDTLSNLLAVEQN